MEQVAVPAPEEPADHFVGIPPARQLARRLAGARRHRVEVHLLVQIPDEEHFVAVGTPHRRRRMPDVQDVLQGHPRSLLRLFASREHDGGRKEHGQKSRSRRPGCFPGALHGSSRLVPRRMTRRCMPDGTRDAVGAIRRASARSVRTALTRSGVACCRHASRTPAIRPPRRGAPLCRPEAGVPVQSSSRRNSGDGRKGVPFWLREEGRRRMEVGPETRTLEPRTGRAHPKRRLRETGRAPAD